MGQRPCSLTIRRFKPGTRYGTYRTDLILFALTPGKPDIGAAIHTMPVAGIEARP